MDKKFIKKCTIIVFFSTIFLIFLSWLYSGFSIIFFTSWKFVLAIILSFVFSIILLPVIISFDSMIFEEKKPLTTKRRVAALILCFALLLFDVILNKLLGFKTSWINYAIDVTFILFLFII